MLYYVYNLSLYIYIYIYMYMHTYILLFDRLLSTGRLATPARPISILLPQPAN